MHALPTGRLTKAMTGRVLVTGSEGFTGQYVTAALECQGWQVISTGVKALDTRKDYIQADLSNPSQVTELVHSARADAVIHLAAIAFVAHGDPGAFYALNVVATRHLLAALAECAHQPTSVVLASSANIYGNQTAGTLSETTTPNPANDYAVSKLAMEYMAKMPVTVLAAYFGAPAVWVGKAADTPFDFIIKARPAAATNKFLIGAKECDATQTT